MIPELAFVYVTGLPANIALSGLHAFLFKKKVSSTPMRQVQSNLQSLEMFWSESESKIKKISDGSFESDKAAYYKTVFRIGIICFFLSWIGFFLQLLIMTSIRFIARPRLEKALFESMLANRKTSPDETKSELKNLSERVMNSEIPALE